MESGRRRPYGSSSRPGVTPSPRGGVRRDPRRRAPESAAVGTRSGRNYLYLEVKLFYHLLVPVIVATTVTISSKGQITLPKALRDRHHLGEGDEALVVDTEAGILIRPRPRHRLYGLLKDRIEAGNLERSIRRLRRESHP